MRLLPDGQPRDAQRRRPQLIVLITSSVVTVLGCIALVAWHLYIPALIRILPGDTVMVYNTALCFVFAGAGFYAAGTQRSLLAFISGSSLVFIGLITLSEYLFGLDLGLDQAFMVDTEVRVPFPGRMTLASAVSFILSGLSIVLMSQEIRWTWTRGLFPLIDLVGLMGTILIVIGATTILLFLTGMYVPYGWGKFSHSMAVSSAVGLVVLGTGIGSWAWHRSRATTISEIRWLPFFVQAGGITLTLLLWQALLVQEHRGIEATISRTMAHMKSEISSRMESRILALSRMAARSARMDHPVQEEWAADAEMIVLDFPGFQAIAWIDSSLKVRWIAPMAGNEMLLETTLMADSVRRALFERVRDTRMPSISRTMDLAQGGKGFVVYVPIFRGGNFAGVIAGGFRAETLFIALLHGIAPGYSLVVMAADEELYRRLPAEPALEAEWGQQATAEFVGTRWYVRVWPQAATLAAYKSLLPAWALGSGLLATVLISMVIALAQESRRSARLEKIANRELVRENAKREEAEMEVRVLNAKLEQRVKERTTALARANADLRQLAYVSAHDLREPVRMVSTYTQLLARRYQGKLDAEADQFINYTIEGSSRMHMLLIDLLDYLQIDQTEVDKSETNCEEILENALSGLQSTITATAALVTHDPLPTVHSNAMQLTRVFHNLLENALLFRLSPPPRVHVWADRRDDVWLFAVRDNGIGIEPKYAKQIFHMFERLHTQAEYPGTGMGLTLCQKIVERLGGEIWVESQIGQGATFYFTIPLVEDDEGLDLWSTERDAASG